MGRRRRSRSGRHRALRIFAAVGAAVTALAVLPAMLPAAAAGAGTTTTFAGGNGTGDGGPPASASLNTPTPEAMDGAGALYIGDQQHFRIRKVTPGADGVIGGTNDTDDAISTVAGNGAAGFSGDGGPATSASLQKVAGLTVDGSGNVFIADNGNRVREVSAAGTITTVAGNGTGGFVDNVAAPTGELKAPAGLAVDGSGNLYIADSGNARVRFVCLQAGACSTSVGSVASGNITTIAGGASAPGCDNCAATLANIPIPISVAVDGSSNFYVGDQGSCCGGQPPAKIRKVTSGGTITTICTVGTTCTSALALPSALWVDSGGTILDEGNPGNQVFRVTIATAAVAVLAGVGGNNGYCGAPTAACGDGAAATAALLNSPEGVVQSAAGDVLIADQADNRIRRVSAGGIITTAVGNGLTTALGDGAPATAGSLATPSAVAVDRHGNTYIADRMDHRIRMVNAAGIMSTVAGNGTAGFAGDGGPATSAELFQPQGIAVDRRGNLYVVDTGNGLIRFVCQVASGCSTPFGAVATGSITTIAGGGTTLGDGGTATSAQLRSPLGVAVDWSGNLYVSDTQDNRVRYVCMQQTTCTTTLTSAASGVIKTVAGTGTADYTGDGAAASAATLNQPDGVTVDNRGNLYVADSNNNVVRLVCLQSPSCTVPFGGGSLAVTDITTVVGKGPTFAGYSGDGHAAQNAQLSAPRGVAVDAAGNLLVADSANSAVRFVCEAASCAAYSPVGTVSNGNIVTLAGTGTAGFSGDGGLGSSATLNTPVGVAYDGVDTAVIADSVNNRVRRVQVPVTQALPTVTSVTPASGSGATAQTVTITGTGLAAANTVSFGTAKTYALTPDPTTPDTKATIADPGTLSSAGGTVDITVSAPGGVSATSASDHFTFASWGLLRITTPSGGLPTQISADGNFLDSYGTNWVGLDTGTHQVCYSDVEGWDTPACQSVTINQGATTVISAPFTQRGFLQAMISPAGVDGTVSVDGAPADDYGVLTDLPAGSHMVCFSAVASFSPPPCQNVTLTAGQTTVVTGTYTSSPGASGQTGTGLLRVTTNPPLASQISFNGIPRDTWGTQWTQVTPGSYTVCFRSVQGYTAPACQTVSVAAGATTTVQGNFTQQGHLHATLSPAGIDAVVTVDGAPRDDYGMFTDVPAGVHTVCYGIAAGAVPPPCDVVTVGAGQTVTSTGVYS